MCICHISFLDSYRIGMARPQCCLSNQMTYMQHTETFGQELKILIQVFLINSRFSECHKMSGRFFQILWHQNTVRPCVEPLPNFLGTQENDPLIKDFSLSGQCRLSSTLSSLINEHARLAFVEFFTTVFSTSYVINEKNFHPTFFFHATNCLNAQAKLQTLCRL